MTDEQIIKAMEYCCGNIKSDEECSEDMCYQASLPEDRNGDTRWCRQWLIKDAFDLINRKTEEFADLKKENDVLKTNYQSVCMSLPNMAKAERKEAIKEFAERLKETAYSYSDICGYSQTVVDVDSIDKLVKEMTRCRNEKIY